MGLITVFTETYRWNAGWTVPVSFWDAGDLGFVTVSVTPFVTAVTQQQEVLIIPLFAHLTILKRQTHSLKKEKILPEVCFQYLEHFLTTFMIDLSQAIDFCSCWMHMASWAALRTSLRAFLHTFIPWATSSSPLREDGKMRIKNAL